MFLRQTLRSMDGKEPRYWSIVENRRVSGGGTVQRHVLFCHWLDHVANVRVHATTRRVVAEHFAEEQPTLQSLPAGPFQAVLRLERRVTRDSMISVDGNLYSVPNTTYRRVVDVQCTANEVRVVEDGRIVAVHPVLHGRGERRIAAGIAPCRCRPTIKRGAMSHAARRVR